MKTVFIIHESLSLDYLTVLKKDIEEKGFSLSIINLNYFNRTSVLNHIKNSNKDLYIIFDEKSMRLDDIDYFESKLVGERIRFYSNRRILCVHRYMDLVNEKQKSKEKLKDELFNLYYLASQHDVKNGTNKIIEILENNY